MALVKIYYKNRDEILLCRAEGSKSISNLGWTGPDTLEQTVPVDGRNDFHVEHLSSLADLALVDGEGFQRLASVSGEFSQNQLLAADNERAAGITVVFCLLNLLAFQVSNQVMLQDTGFSSDSCCSLRGR